MLENFDTMIKNKTLVISGIAVLFVGLVGCSKDPNSPGYEYMPDMYRSRSVEAYVDYSNLEEQSARIPAKGTIAFSEDESKAVFNFPYTLPETTEGYEMAAGLKNPVVYSEAVMAKGKDIYEKFCIHCHGEKGDGQGSIVKNGKLAGVPAYNTGALKELPEGKMFHSITYGKGLMGSHAGQLSKEERWTVIHYVRYLQNDGKYPVSDAGNAAVEADSTQNNG